MQSLTDDLGLEIVILEHKVGERSHYGGVEAL